jgi:serine/threonine protein kinase
MATRSYIVHALIGQGGFGKVYRATLDGGAGFRKQVAIKLLMQDAISKGILERFRDEARILGLVRDRAFVSVDPPMRLAGSYAVVMDYVEGESARGLLRHGPMPATVALEIVEEVARSLGFAWNQPGPDGKPLHLLHRDLKPGNLQITPRGEVKVLDFGIARANFDDREAKTTDDWAGTAGFTAPERYEGIEGPPGDVYSLGVVLRVLATLDKPVGVGQFKSKHKLDPALAPLIQLSRDMCQEEHTARPTMREVEGRCHELRRKMPGPSLRDWAELHVEVHRGETLDDACGQRWEEENAMTPAPAGRASAPGESVAPAAWGAPKPPPMSAADTAVAPTSGPSFRTTAPTDLRAAGLGALGGIAFALIAGAGLVGALAVGLWVATTFSSPSPSNAPTAPAVVMPAPAPDTAPVAAPPSTAPVAAPTAPTPAPATAPAPNAPTPANPAPAPLAAAPAPAPPAPPPAPAPIEVAPAPAPAAVVATAPTRPVTFGSVPFGAEVWVDGAKLPGKTPFTNVPIAEGAHRVKMVHGDQAAERTFQVGAQGAAKLVWTVGQDIKLVQ